MVPLSPTKDKYNHPKYAIKMATGTGKTWVLNALLIWQYLNAKHEDQTSGHFTKNFLIVAPGIIVYERLLDAYLGKEQEVETGDINRNFDESYFSRLHTVAYSFQWIYNRSRFVQNLYLPLYC